MKMKHIFLISMLCALGGSLWYVYHAEIILIRWKISSSSKNMHSSKQSSFEKVILHYWYDNKWHTDTTTVIKAPSVGHNIHQLTSHLFKHLEELHIVEKAVTIQSVVIEPATLCAYISFDRSPFSKHQSIRTKWMLLESLLKTLRENGCAVSRVQFLIRHKPFQDVHLFLDQPWPLCGFESYSNKNMHLSSFNHKKIILINSAGNSHYTGRKLNHEYERTIAYQCAEQLKAQLQKAFPTYTILFTRYAGQSINQIQCAQMANKLEAQLYININVYKNNTPLPSIDIYHYGHSTQCITKVPELWLCPYTDAYLISQSLTTVWAQKWIHILAMCVGSSSNIGGPYKIPCQSLQGITTPALSLEIGIINDNDWEIYIPALVNAIQKTLTIS